MQAVLSNTGAWSAAVGVVMPWLIAVVNQPRWSPNVRSTVAIVAAVIGGLLTSLATGAFAHGPLTVAGACLTVVIASQAVYGKLFPASQAKLELLTSPGTPGRHEALAESKDAAKAA